MTPYASQIGITPWQEGDVIEFEQSGAIKLWDYLASKLKQELPQEFRLKGQYDPLHFYCAIMGHASTNRRQDLRANIKRHPAILVPKVVCGRLEAFNGVSTAIHGYMTLRQEIYEEGEQSRQFTRIVRFRLTARTYTLFLPKEGRVTGVTYRLATWGKTTEGSHPAAIVALQQQHHQHLMIAAD